MIFDISIQTILINIILIFITTSAQNKIFLEKYIIIFKHTCCTANLRIKYSSNTCNLGSMLHIYTLTSFPLYNNDSTRRRATTIIIIITAVVCT